MGKSKDELLATDESTALHWKNEKVKDIETEDEEDIFKSSRLTWVVAIEASEDNDEDNEPRVGRSMRAT